MWVVARRPEAAALPARSTWVASTRVSSRPHRGPHPACSGSQDVPQVPDGAFAVVLGGDRLVQVLSAAVDHAGSVVAGQPGQGGDRTTARFLAVAVVMSTGGNVDVLSSVRVMVLVGADSSRARCWLSWARAVSPSVV